EAGVAFLDEIEERQAAIAVALGDRDYQPQVGGGEDTFGFIVELALLVGARDESSERSGRFERDPHQVAELGRELNLLLGTNQPFWLIELLLDLHHAGTDLVNLRHDRKQPPKAEIQLLDQADNLIAADHEATPGGFLFGFEKVLRDCIAEIDLVMLEQLFDRY